MDICKGKIIRMTVKSLHVNRVDVTGKKEIADNLNLHFSTTKNFSTNININYLKYLTKVSKEATAFELVHETHH